MELWKLAAIGGGIWYFLLRDKTETKKEAQPLPTSGYGGTPLGSGTFGSWEDLTPLLQRLQELRPCIEGCGLTYQSLIAAMRDRDWDEVKRIRNDEWLPICWGAGGCLIEALSILNQIIIILRDMRP